MTKQQIFKNAWRIARKASNHFGGSSKDFFAESLKLAKKYIVAVEYIDVSYPHRVELYVERTDGKIETITHPSLKQLTQNQFGQIQKATKAAGRGNVTAYRNIKMEKPECVLITDADMAAQSSYEINRMMSYGEK